MTSDAASLNVTDDGAPKLGFDRVMGGGTSRHSLHVVAPPQSLARLRYQMGLGLLLSVLIPTLVYNYQIVSTGYEWEANSLNTAAGGAAAFLIALYLFRRIISFPGIGIVGHVLPALTAGYGGAVAVFFGLRLDYSRLTFFASFVIAALFFFGVSTYLTRRKGQRFLVIPSRRTRQLPHASNVEWIMLKEPRLPTLPHAVLVADLRANLGKEWERLIADAALAGIPVYNVNQVHESLTGQVEIEHLSENSFGSLLPNLSYHKIKRSADLVAALVALPLLAIPALIVACLIRLDTPGPVFFRQQRRGYRGKVFVVLKFRTMSDSQGPGDRERDSSVTRTGDARITKVGRILRRSRIDELPQIWNIIRGEMSWIGPRPEALPLSQWYEEELPFYTYRHIVRPGITGWAQVNQGHVADLGAVYEKLHYDFYYIKNFSAWLDFLILGKTVITVFTGFGSK